MKKVKRINITAFRKDMFNELDDLKKGEKIHLLKNYRHIATITKEV